MEMQVSLIYSLRQKQNKPMAFGFMSCPYRLNIKVLTYRCHIFGHHQSPCKAESPVSGRCTERGHQTRAYGFQQGLRTVITVWPKGEFAGFHRSRPVIDPSSRRYGVTFSLKRIRKCQRNFYVQRRRSNASSSCSFLLWFCRSGYICSEWCP